jgi:Arc/MetJ family transcription regulator
MRTNIVLDPTLIARAMKKAGEPLLHEDRDFRSIAEVEPALVLVG